MREIRTLRARRRELETEPRTGLNGHAGGNPGYSQASVLTGHRASSRPYLLPFHPKKELPRAIRAWFRNDPERVKLFNDMLRTTPPLADLLTNPLFFMLACRGWEYRFEDAIRRHGSPPSFETRCDLYERSLKHFYGRWVDRTKERGQGPSELGRSSRGRFRRKRS